jgi:hypothetical protein
LHVPTLAEYLPSFAQAVHGAATIFAQRASTDPQIQQTTYFEALYGLIVATEWSVGEELDGRGVPPEAREFISHYVSDALLGEVLHRRLRLPPHDPHLAAQRAAHRQAVRIREEQYRRAMTGPNGQLGFSQLHAMQILRVAGLDPSHQPSLEAAVRDVDQALAALQLPEAAVHLTTH